MRVSRFWVWLLFLLAVSGPLLAAPSLEAFEEHLDRYAYDEALQIAEKLPDPQEQNLALAEHALATGRPDLSFVYTDRLEASGLAAPLLGKYHLIRAGQVKHSHFPTANERELGVKRMIREGLRSSPRPRDRAVLLLLRVQETAPNRLALAEDAVRELGELQLEGPYSIYAQALLASKKGEHAQSASLWKTLAEAARLKSQPSAAYAYTLRESLETARTGRSEQALTKLIGLVQGDGSAPVALRAKAWHELLSLARRLRAEERVWALVEQRMERMPEDAAKLRVLHDLVWLDSERALSFARQAREMAAQLNDPILEAHFWLRQAAVSERYHDRDAYRRKALALVSEETLRGTYGVWYGGAYGLLQDTNREGESEPATLEEFETLLAKRQSPQERKETFSDALTKSTYDGNSELARRAFLGGLREALALPEPDNRSWVEELLSSHAYRLRWDPVRPATEARLDLTEPLARALSLELRREPELVESLVELSLKKLDEARAPRARRSALSTFASLLTALGREREALEFYRRAATLEAEEASSPSHLHRFRLGEAMLALGDKDGLGLVEPYLRARRANDPPAMPALYLGFSALQLGELERAETWAREAVALVDQAGGTTDWRARVLLARVLLAREQTEEGLAVLDEGMRSTTLGGEDYSRFQKERVSLLLKAGRPEEASRSLNGLGYFYGRGVFEELTIRYKVARALDDRERAEALKLRLTALLDNAASQGESPVFEHFLLRRYGAIVDQTPPPLALERLQEGLPEVLESLERLRRREPTNEALKRLGAGELKGLMSQAGPRELFIQPVLLEHSVVSLCIGQDEIVLRERFCDRQRLDRAMLEVVSGLAVPSSDPGAVEEQRRYLTWCLVEPWRERFPDKSKVMWMGDERLQRVPLGVLYDRQGAPLLGRIEPVYLDGPATLPPLTLAPDSPALLVGGATELAGSHRELRAVRELFPTGERWEIGAELERLRQLTPRHRLLHISTHGVAPSNTDLSGTLVGDQGSVTAFELAGLVLPEGSLAVLATCDSSLDSGSGRDISSLVSALRTAGADAVIGSVWQLDDQVAPELFAVFYQNLRQGLSVDAALSRAQQTIAREHPHPYYWAGLRVVSGP